MRKKRKIRRLINSDNAIDVGVDVMLIVFDVLSSPILIVVRVLRYAFNKFIRGYVIRGIKWVLNKIIYSPDKPLSCGARVWIETEAEVKIA